MVIRLPTFGLMKNLSFLIFFSLIILGKTSFADEAKPSFIKSYTLGAELNNYRYVEPGLIAHSGFMLGVFAEMTWTYFLNLNGITSANIVWGELNYDGSLCDVNTNICTDYQAKTIDVISRVTHRFVYLIKDDFNFFIGPGFRILIDKGRGDGFYTRTGNYFFLPLGINFNYQNFNFDFEYDFLLSGTMKSKLSEVNKTFGDVRHKQSVGSGHKITLNRKMDDLAVRTITASLYYESWNFADSDPEQLLINNQPSGNFFIEPKNFTQVIGLQLGFLF